MAFAGVGEAVKICQSCLNLYSKIQVPGQRLTSLHNRVEQIRKNLVALEIVHSSPNGIARLQPNLREDLATLIGKAQDELLAAQRIFKQYDPARLDIMSQAKYFVSPLPRKVDAITDNLAKISNDIDEIERRMQTLGMNALIINLHMQQDASNLEQLPLYKPKPVAQAKYGRTGFNVVFVDDYNTTWSIVGAAYTKLLEARMEQFPGAYWPIAQCHSVGILVEANSNLPLLPDEYRAHLIPGAQTPNSTALTTLFNDSSEDANPHLDVLRSHFSNRLSRGLYGDIFDDSDYIFVFEQRTLDIMERLRSFWGRDSSKAKIVLLGKYWPSPESGKDIYPVTAKDLALRAKPDQLWTRRISRIKVSIKLWLNREFGWTEPSYISGAAPQTRSRAPLPV